MRSQDINITLIKNPLKPIESMVTVSTAFDEVTVIEYIERVTGPIDEELVISLNDQLVENDAVPKEGDHIIFCLVLKGGGGDGGKTVLRAVAVIAVMVAAVYTGGLAATAYGPLAGALTSAAVTAAGSLLINAVLPPPGVETAKLQDANFDRSTNYGWGAPTNAWQEGVVLPSLIGKRRFAPPRIGGYRYQPPDNSQQQYLRLLYALCDDVIEDLTEDDIFINGRKISDYPQTTFAYTIGNDGEDYSLKWFHEGTLAETQHSTNISEQEEIHNGGVNYVNFQDDVWQPVTPYTITQNVEVITIRALFPKGMKHKVMKTVTKGKHEGRQRLVTKAYHGFKFVMRYRLSSGTTWMEKEFTVIPENRYYKKFWRTFVLDGLTSGAYDLQFTVRASKANPLEVKGLTGLSSLSTLPVITTTGTSVEKIGIGLMLPSGLYYVNDGGGFSDHTVKVGINIRVKGTTQWMINHTETITDHTSATIRRFIAFDNLSANQYEIRVYVSGLLPTDKRYSHNLLLDYIQEGIEQHLVYRGVACLAVEVLATDALHGQYPTIEVIGKCSEYATGRASDNPAWAAYYRLRRHDIDEGKIDLAQFETWASFCTTHNLTCNLYLDTQLSLQAVLNNIGIAGRGHVVNRGGRWGVIVDDVTIPKQTFNIDDIIEDSFEETFLPSSELANTVICWFFDEAQDYRRTAVEVRDPKVIEGAEVKKMELTLYGVTQLDQAKKHAMVMLNQTRLINRTVSWRADIDAINSQVGDVVFLQHNVPEWGASAGRVVSADATSITVDTPNDYSNGETETKDYRLCIRHKTPKAGENIDFLEVKAVNNPFALGSPANENVITYTLKTGVIWERIPEAGDLVSVGWVTGSEASTGEELLSLKQFRIINLERYQEQQFKLTGVEYYDDAYEDDYIVTLPAPESGLSKVDMIKVNSAWAVNGQLHTDYISLSWVGNAPIYYIFYKTKQSGEWSEWRFYQSTGNTSLQINDLPTGQEYLFSVSTQNNPEKGSQGNIVHDTADHGNIIQPITNIKCVQTGTTQWNGKDLDVTWDPFPMFSLSVYRVEILNDANVVLRSELTGKERYTYTYDKNVQDNQGVADPTVRIRVVVIDQNDNEATSITQAFNNTIPSVPTNFFVLDSDPPTTDFHTINLELTWDSSPDEDFYAFEIWQWAGRTPSRIEIVFNNYFHYTHSMMVSEGGYPPHETRHMYVRTIDAFGQVSEWNSKTFTNQPPNPPSNLSAEPWMNGVRFVWEQLGAKLDLAGFTYRLQIESEPFTEWIDTPEFVVIRFLSEAESIAYNGQANITIELKTLDTFGNESTVVTATHQTGSLNIAPTSITDFSQISNAFPKIPVLIGDTWTDNNPTAGSVLWNEHSLWFNGVEHVIISGSTADQYIFWNKGATHYSGSADIPVLPDDSFIIATNINGFHDLAWNAIANQIIGSAYIKDAAIHDLHVSDISAEKLTANSIMTPGVYIGGAKYGSSGATPSIDELKPAEGGATDGATFGTNIFQGDHVFNLDEMINNPSNLFIDSNFSKTQSVTDTTYWQFNETNVLFRTDAGYNVSKAAQLIATTGQTVRLRTIQNFPWSPNKKLFSTGRIFIESTFDGTIDFGIGALDHNQAALGEWQSYSISTDVKHAWITFSGDVTPTNPNTAFILVWIFISGTTGSVTIDELYAAPFEDGANITENHISLDTANVGGYDTSLITATKGYVFQETFEDPKNDFGSRWYLPIANGEWNILSASNHTDSVTGGKYVRVGDNSGDDMTWFIFNRSIPYNPSKLYRLKFRVRNHTPAGNPGRAHFGVTGRNYNDTEYVNKVGANDYGNFHEIAGTYIDVPRLGWIEYTGYFKGVAVNGGSHAPNPSSPAPLHQNCKYFRPCFLLHQGNQLGMMDIDEISIDIIPEDADQIAESVTKKWAGETGATVGANWQSNLGNIPIRFADAPQGAGLYVTSTHLGYHTGTSWKTYIQNNGVFYFGGDANQYIFWDGSNLAIHGEITVTNPGAVRTDINVQDGATNDAAWRHPSDVTKINGGAIYTSTISLNSINGASGVLNIKAGGQINVTAGKINITTANGLEVAGTGDILVRNGGDIIMKSEGTNQSKIVFTDDSPSTNDVNVVYSGGYLFFDPTTSSNDSFSIGTPANNWGSFNLHTKGYTVNVNDSSNTVLQLAYEVLGTEHSYQIVQYYSPHSRLLKFSVQSNGVSHFGPEPNNTIDCGTDLNAWQDIYYYVPHDKCLYLDDLDDLKILHEMKPSKELDPQCNLPKLDLNSLPRWMTNYDKLKEKVFAEKKGLITDDDFDTLLKDEDKLGFRLFRKSGHFMDIVAGSVRQLDLKINDLIKRLAKMEK